MPEIRDPDAPATDSQKRFLRGLAHGKNIPNYEPGQAWTFVEAMEKSGRLTKKFASDLIDMWTKLPDRQYKPGYYRLQIDPATEPMFIHLVENKAKTGTYTKVWDGFNHRWEYAPDHKKFIPEAEPMTVEQMAKFGQVTGYCIVCGAELTDPASVTRGMGPVCFSRVQP